MRRRFAPNTAALYGAASSTPTLADVQAIVNAQTFGGIWVATGGSYSDAGTTLATDGGTIQQVNDRSSFANHLTQASAGLRPFYRASAGGYPAIHGDGTRCIRTPSAITSLAHPYYRIAAVQWINHTTAFATMFGDRNTTDRGLLIQNSSSGNMAIYDGSMACAIAISDGTEIVTTELHNGASSSLQVDNNSAVTGNPGANVATGLTLFTDGANSQFGTAYVRGVVIVPGGISGANLATIKTYLGSLAGRTI